MKCEYRDGNIIPNNEGGAQKYFGGHNVPIFSTLLVLLLKLRLTEFHSNIVNSVKGSVCKDIKKCKCPESLIKVQNLMRTMKQ